MAAKPRKPRSRKKKSTEGKLRKPVKRATPVRFAVRKASVKPKVSLGKAASAHDSLDEFIAAAAGVLEMACDPAWLPEIKSNLQVILRHAALVDEFSLPDEASPAPVYRA